MAHRYTSIKLLDSCLSPVTIWHHGRSYVVPCGKCMACKLSKANDWSMRLGSEIASSSFTIWFTLTYSNKYLPTLQKKYDGDKVVYYSDHCNNIRFDGKKDVSRVDDIEIVSGDDMVTPEVTNLFDDSRCSYLSKRDIQLYYKNLRKDIYETFKGIDGIQSYSIRYFCVGEYGSTKFRAHSHHLVFCESKEVCDYLLQVALYKNWQMCDKALFDQYVRLASDGVRNYVTEYVTSFTRLPQIYQCESVRPFRLSSKSPAIGYSCFDEEKIFDDVLDGIINYSKTVDRIERKYLLRYPKSYIFRLFPKCWRYSEKPYHLLLSTYGLLWHLVVERGFNFDLVSKRLRKYRNPLDYYATSRCFKVCTKYGWHPDTFLWYVDRVHYLYEIDNLRRWYQWQEIAAKEGRQVEIILSYANIGDLCQKVNSTDLEKQSLWYFIVSFNLSFDYFIVNYKSILASYRNQLPLSEYITQLGDVLENMDKSNKVNELAKISPSNNPLVY